MIIMIMIGSGSSGFPDGNNPGFEFDNDFADSGDQSLIMIV